MTIIRRMRFLLLFYLVDIVPSHACLIVIFHVFGLLHFAPLPPLRGQPTAQCQPKWRPTLELTVSLKDARFEPADCLTIAWCVIREPPPPPKRKRSPVIVNDVTMCKILMVNCSSAGPACCCFSVTVYLLIEGKVQLGQFCRRFVDKKNFCVTNR